ncbi:maleylpyruvate isomerase family mycothiol-dependent enzyme [Georgenia sp. MJ206]|uniref:maleylpyruvate isomerase family mycothiol-dependent enzyme n=1 Tax=Georgenia wangjunii TaxID=3117730 RepID=UPI002F26BC79
MGAALAWSTAAAERRALADDLDNLTDEQWTTASLCAGWDVRTVTAHLVAALDPSPRPLVAALVRTGGRPHRANGVVARRTADQPIADLVSALRQRADTRAAPPVIGARGPLTDVLVHSGDIRLPLGLRHEPSPEGVRMALDFVVDGRPVGFTPRGRLTGLRLLAEDLGASWGEGEPVAGRGIDLLMAACGRSTVLGQLHGPGADLLARRLDH